MRIANSENKYFKNKTFLFKTNVWQHTIIILFICARNVHSNISRL